MTRLLLALALVLAAGEGLGQSLYIPLSHLAPGSLSGQVLFWNGSVMAAGAEGVGFTFGNVTSIVASHNLGSTVVRVWVYDASGFLVRPKTVQIVDANTVLVVFDSAIGAGRVVIK